MQNRTAAVIITILAALFLACPGLGALCFGFVSLIDFAAGSQVLAHDNNTYVGIITGSFCGGFLLLVIAVVIAVLVLRRKKQPLPPASPEEPLPPPL